jgi:hypothetical protein
MRVFIMLILFSMLLYQCTQKPAFEAPPITRECKPWVYWWWLGSAVDQVNLSYQLKHLADAGYGGVHIIPIYGVKGYEDRFIKYLSPEWMEMLAHTVTRANKLGLGVDMSTGTGWPFGGPHVNLNSAAKQIQLQTYPLAAGKSLEAPIAMAEARYRENSRLWKLFAVNARGESLDLMQHLDSTSTLQWKAPRGNWTVVAVFEGHTNQKVKRAAPGAEGMVMDYFSQNALQHYLARFDTAFAGYDGPPIRAMYNDSYEVYGANWTKNFPAEFEKRRGYNLLAQLPALAGLGAPETVARVKCDYRETLADLLLDEFTTPWVNWSHANQWITRNEAHGSPGNLLDLYAAADVPETEIFGPSGFPIPGLHTDPDFPDHRSLPDPLMMKFASSAAHVAGKLLVSSESCTWLGEHFRVALSQVKPEIDQLFLGGINHVFYHGVAYSPEEETWPGWLFYASTNFAPSNAFWHDLPALNSYIARCQSFLQYGQSANDILLYWPVHDRWQNPDKMLLQFTVHNLPDWLYQTPFHAAAEHLWQRGYTFDYVSDRQLTTTQNESTAVRINQGTYQTIVVPDCQFMPVSTLQTLQKLAEGGATILFLNDLPRDVPGLDQLEKRRNELQQFRQRISEARPICGTQREIKIGRGRWVIADSLNCLPEILPQMKRESLVDSGLQFIRRRHADGWIYFIVNLRATAVSTWLALGKPATSALLRDPRLERKGRATLRNITKESCEVFLQLKPGESRILWTHDSAPIPVQPWEYDQPNGDPVMLAGNWEVKFIQGGPSLPQPFQTDRLESWTTRDDSAAQSFAGTARYRLTFDKPVAAADDWLLDLGDVQASARVRLNDREVGILWSIPFEMRVGRWLRAGANTLEIDVTNLSANRIRDLDRRGVVWRKFHDINFVNIDYKPFDASDWPLQPSGLLGPVRLIPVKNSKP